MFWQLSVELPEVSAELPETSADLLETQSLVEGSSRVDWWRRHNEKPTPPWVVKPKVARPAFLGRVELCGYLRRGHESILNPGPASCACPL